MLESQAQLATTLKDTNTSAAAQSAQLTAAYDTIREYANKSDLSTEAQGRLRAAVETVNSMCGTQISVVDQANGKLADEHGAISDVTGALGEYVEKKLEQIRVDAQQSNLTALYEQQAQDIQTLAVAQKDYNDELNRCMKNNPQMTREQAELTVSYTKQGKALDEAKAALGAVNNSIDTVTESLGASVAVADGATASVKDLAAASPAVSSAFVGLGKDLGQFCDDLQSAGISVEDFQSLSDEQLIKLAASWDGTTGSIIKALGDMGVKCKTEGQAAADNWASGLSAGAQGAIGAAQQVTGSTLEEFKRNCDDYGIAGDAAVTAFANALAQGDTYDVAAAKAREAVGGLDEAKQGGSDAGTLAGALFASGITTGGAPTEGQRGGAGRSAGERHLDRHRRRIRDGQLRRSGLRAGHRRQHAADIEQRRRAARGHVRRHRPGSRRRIQHGQVGGRAVRQRNRLRVRQRQRQRALAGQQRQVGRLLLPRRPRRHGQLRRFELRTGRRRGGRCL